MKANKQAKRFWTSWVQPTEDYRPLTDPPNENVLGWWCSGYDSSDQAVLVALVQGENEHNAKTAIAADWPEQKPSNGWRFFREVARDFTPGDRFPMAGWSRERILR